MAKAKVDLYDTSSFNSLIQEEQRDEIIPLDLHAACLIGDVETIEDFIVCQSDLNKLNRGGWTPLMYAANVGRDNVLKILIEAHADINVQSTKNGHTALMLASYCASEAIIHYLLQNGAMINMQDHNGRTSLFHAVKQGHHSAVNLLMDYGADINLCEFTAGWSPIMEAASAGNDNIFNTLLNHGANLNQLAKSGESIRHLAQRRGRTSIVRIIDDALNAVHASMSEQVSIDINQGPRAFEQLCMNATTSENIENERDMNQLDWRSSNHLPTEIYTLFKQYNVPGKYLLLLEKQGIEAEAFMMLTDEDLKSLGVDKLGPRKRIKLVIDEYRQGKTTSEDITMKASSNEPSGNDEIEQLKSHYQQAVTYIQQHEQQWQQDRKLSQDLTKYVEGEKHRMKQVEFCLKDIGKNCRETISQLRKIKEHNRVMECLLNDLKEHPNSAQIMCDLRMDSSLYESSCSSKCEVEMAINRLNMMCKQIDRTAEVAHVQQHVQHENHN